MFYYFLNSNSLHAGKIAADGILKYFSYFPKQ